MAFFVFLGAFILSYCVYKFLRRLECKYFGYHLDFEDDAYEILIGSATIISAGPETLWSNPVPNDNILDPYALNNHPSRNSFEAAAVFKNIHNANSIDDFSNFLNDNPSAYTDEDYYLDRKDKLYLSALNKSCPRKSRKMKKVPTVGNLPTIFEPYIYPLPVKTLMSAEATPFSSNEIEAPHESFIEVESSFEPSREVEPHINSPVYEQSALPTKEIGSEVISSSEPAVALEVDSVIFSPVTKEPYSMSTTNAELDIISSIEPALMSTIEAESNIIAPATPTLVSNTEVETDVILPTESALVAAAEVISPKEPVLIPTIETASNVVSDVEPILMSTTGLESAVDTSVGTRSAQTLNGNNPVSLKSPVAKKKKFWNFRKIFSRLSCIRRIKD